MSMRYEVPIWKKALLTIDEAAAYFNIGEKKLRQITESDDCDLVVWVGSKRLIKRIAMENYVNTIFSL